MARILLVGLLAIAAFVPSANADEILMRGVSDGIGSGGGGGGPTGAILMEDASFILMEDSSHILMES